ncbi:hypothetical protein IWQ60_007306 [Tieghemiomyces parasiticus]|uniref:Uncharacterized protein n=1 Tax=Tieghemiomyces parasiticus TaxID=78921 RepID=A0A9W8A4W6_9FUNG|nr:hypothetical protein IWQ60_007306 [Tieghemiomyces parasiticus]
MGKPAASPRVATTTLPLPIVPRPDLVERLERLLQLEECRDLTPLQRASIGQDLYELVTALDAVADRTRQLTTDAERWASLAKAVQDNSLTKLCVHHQTLHLQMRAQEYEIEALQARLELAAQKSAVAAKTQISAHLERESLLLATDLENLQDRVAESATMTTFFSKVSSAQAMVILSLARAPLVT